MAEVVERVRVENERKAEEAMKEWVEQQRREKIAEEERQKVEHEKQIAALKKQKEILDRIEQEKKDEAER